MGASRVLRYLLLSAAALAVALLISVLSPSDRAQAAPAHGASASDDSLLGGLSAAVVQVVAPVQDVVTVTVQTVIPAVNSVPVAAVEAQPPAVVPTPIAPVAEAAATPVISGVTAVFGAATGALSGAPVTSVTTPITGAVDGVLDGLLGGTAVGDEVLGSTPVTRVLRPVTGLVDGVLVQVADVVGTVGALPVGVVTVLLPGVQPDGVDPAEWLEETSSIGPFEPGDLSFGTLPFSDPAGTAGAFGSASVAGASVSAPAAPGGAPLVPFGAPAGSPAPAPSSSASSAAGSPASTFDPTSTIGALRLVAVTSSDDDALPSSPVFETDTAPD